MAQFIDRDGSLIFTRALGDLNPEEQPDGELPPGVIAEGICPTCGSALERREENGWCARCGVGWAIDPTTVYLTLEVDTSAWDAAVGGLRLSLHPRT